MDRFKFRAWCNGEMYYDVYFDNLEVGKWEDNGDYEIIGDIIPNSMLHHAIIMQCTGLKDKHGKLIYEGDILNLDHEYDIQKGFIVGGSADGFFDDVSYLGCFDDEGREIIGNQFENPELIA